MPSDLLGSLQRFSRWEPARGSRGREVGVKANVKVILGGCQLRRRSAHPVNLDAGERGLGDVQPRGRLRKVVVHGDDADHELVIVPGSQHQPCTAGLHHWDQAQATSLRSCGVGTYRGAMPSYTRRRRRVSSRYVSQTAPIVSPPHTMLCLSSRATPTAAWFVTIWDLRYRAAETASGLRHLCRRRR